MSVLPSFRQSLVKYYYPQVKEAVKAAGTLPNLYVTDFIKDMAAAYPDELHVCVFFDGCQSGCQRIVDGTCTQAAAYNQNRLFAWL